MADSLMHQKQQEHRLQVQSHVKVAVLPMALHKNAKEIKRDKSKEQEEETAIRGRERRIERENNGKGACV